MKKIITYAIAIVICCLTGSCGDFLEESSQDKDYIRSWTDLYELLLGDCYLPVNYTGAYNNYQNTGMFLHLLADEMEEQNLGNGINDAVNNCHYYMFGPSTWQPRIGASENNTEFYTENREWKTYYKYINVANNVIQAATEVPRDTPEEQEGVHRVSGEALFLRAYYYFWLVNVYGQPYNPQTADTDLGVTMKTTYEIEDKIFGRNTVKECYDQILKDLLDAEQHFMQVKTPRKSMYHADLTTVRMLLSRVYLFMQDWEKCAAYSQMVIDSHPTLEDLRMSTSKFMVAKNPENIFSMGGDDLMRTMSAMFQSTRVSLDLYRAYSDNDIRKKTWFWNFGTFTGYIRREAGTPTTETTPDQRSWYNTYYYYPCTGLKSPVSSIFWLRSAEAYMNLAEAEAYMGHEDTARRTLAKLLENRYVDGCQELVLNETGSQLISRIRKERRLEFPLEGHRWFDLRRYRVCTVQPEKCELQHTYTVYRDGSTGNIIETRLYVLGEDDPGWTVNIPHEVLEFNVGMPDNGNTERSYKIIPTPE